MTLNTFYNLIPGIFFFLSAQAQNVYVAPAEVVPFVVKAPESPQEISYQPTTYKLFQFQVASWTEIANPNLNQILNLKPDRYKVQFWNATREFTINLSQSSSVFTLPLAEIKNARVTGNPEMRILIDLSDRRAQKNFIEEKFSSLVSDYCSNFNPVSIWFLDPYKLAENIRLCEPHSGLAKFLELGLIKIEYDVATDRWVILGPGPNQRTEINLENQEVTIPSGRRAYVLSKQKYCAQSRTVYVGGASSWSNLKCGIVPKLTNEE